MSKCLEQGTNTAWLRELIVTEAAHAKNVSSRGDCELL